MSSLNSKMEAIQNIKHLFQKNNPTNTSIHNENSNSNNTILEYLKTLKKKRLSFSSKTTETYNTHATET